MPGTTVARHSVDAHAGPPPSARAAASPPPPSVAAEDGACPAVEWSAPGATSRPSGLALSMNVSRASHPAKAAPTRVIPSSEPRPLVSMVSAGAVRPGGRPLPPCWPEGGAEPGARPRCGLLGATLRPGAAGPERSPAATSNTSRRDHMSATLAERVPRATIGAPAPSPGTTPAHKHLQSLSQATRPCAEGT